MRKLFNFFIVFVICFVSCKKNNTGGACNVKTFPQHHGKPIRGATMYVKFAANDLPNNPTSNYNLKITAQPNEEQININGLRYGNYYLYSEGYDSSIAQIVRGGLALKIKWSERKKEVDVNVPVTE